MTYKTRQIGALYSADYLAYIESNGKVVSPFHDVPLYANPEKTILNMVVEIPRWSNAKLEISKDLDFNPIKQDVKKGKLRFVRNCFPHHGYIWNYGAFPQTWENPTESHPETNAVGDNDPLDVVEIGEKIGYIGQVKQVKVLGVMALLDEGETDWKIIAIDITDPLAAKLNDIEDVEKLMPGLLRATNEWFRIYKIPDGKPENVFAFSGEAKNKSYALNVVAETHDSWQKLITGKIPNKSDKYNIKTVNTSVEGSPYKGDSSGVPPENKLPPNSVDASIDKSFFIVGNACFHKIKTYETIKELNKPTTVLIVAEGKSGSTAVSEAFNQNDDIWYLFEPLRKFRNDSETYRSILGVALDSCEFDTEISSKVFWGYGSMRNKWFKQEFHNVHPRNINFSDYAVIHKIRNKCSSSKVRVAKVIRVKDLKMLQQFNSTLKIIYLIRDPRAILSSRIKKNWIKPAKIEDGINELCTSMERKHEDVNRISIPVYQLKYEEFLLNPVKYTLEMYKFIGVDNPGYLEKRLEKVLSKDLHRRGRRFEIKKNEWKAYLTLEQQSRIEEKCKKISELKFWSTLEALFNKAATVIDFYFSTMSSGVSVEDKCLEVFTELKLKKKYRFIIYKLSDDNSTIVVEKLVESGTYDDFIQSMPKGECRYAIYDFEFEKPGEGARHKICFFAWAPEAAKIKPKMLYASSKDALRKKLVGVASEIQCTDLAEISYDAVLEKVGK